MKNDEKHLSLRIENELLKKFEFTAKYDDRSMNSMLLFLIKKHIDAFEREHGKIESD